MSFLPATIEIIGYLLIAPWLLGISLIDAAVMGAVMAAVSPGIVLFAAFLSMAQGGAIHYQDIFNIPISIIAGIGLGVLTGWLLLLFFKWAHAHIGLTEIQKVIIMLAISFILAAIEKWLSNTIAISGLLAVMSMASVIKMRGPIPQSTKLSKQFGNIWIVPNYWF